MPDLNKLEQLERRVRDLETRYNKDRFSSRRIFKSDVEVSDGRNLLFGTGIGTKIGTATDQKLAFYGGTPVDQPATVADPTVGSITGSDTVDETAVQSALNDLDAKIQDIIDRLQELNLIA